MPPGMTIVGLGPGSRNQWTPDTAELLARADEVLLRTAAHPAAADIPGATRSFDDWLASDDPLAAARRIAGELVRLARRDSGVIYAVPGSPHVAEFTTPVVRAAARAQQILLTVLPGLSVVDSALAALDVSVEALQLADAVLVAARRHAPLEPDRPALVAHLQGRPMAARVQASLQNAYPADFEVWLVQHSGSAAPATRPCHLSELATQPNLSALTTLYLPPEPRAGFSAFQETIARLRAPDGCPWDRQQTHQTLRPYLLEETYEVLEALDAGDPDALAEELGDLLLQIVLHTQVAIDQDEFNMAAVIEHINRKLIRRHPHVFGNVVVNGVDDVTSNWAAIKKAEKAEKGQSEAADSALDGVPPALPALAQAMAVSKKAVRAGFEWPNIEGVLDKVVEEAHEIVTAANPAHLESEIGDLLFSVVNLARWRGIDPESALRATNARFGRRFRRMEALARANGKPVPELSIAEMDVLWERAKKMEQGDD